MGVNSGVYPRILLGLFVEHEDVTEGREAEVHEHAAEGHEEPHAEGVPHERGLPQQRRVREVGVEVGLQQVSVRQM